MCSNLSIYKDHGMPQPNQSTFIECPNSWLKHEFVGLNYVYLVLNIHIVFTAYPEQTHHILWQTHTVLKQHSPQANTINTLEDKDRTNASVQNNGVHNRRMRRVGMNKVIYIYLTLLFSLQGYPYSLLKPNAFKRSLQQHVFSILLPILIRLLARHRLVVQICCCGIPRAYGLSNRRVEGGARSNRLNIR